MAEFDFTSHREAMAARMGHDGRPGSWRHLSVVLTALAAEPDKAFALTEGAEPAAHDLMLDTEAVIGYSRAVRPGHVLAHNPYAWGTDEFAAALENTAQAFHRAGLPRPTLSSAGELHPAMCFLSMQAL